ncbi:MAG: MFS transporter [Acidobacteriota bacterium]|nr:MFS transporter [Acidobacteriota bacterium]
MAPRNDRDRRSIVAWALYDFANSPFTTLVITFIYATYFTQVMASSEERGTILWSRGVTVTALVVALLSPLLGALADRGGFRKLFLGISTVCCVVACLALFWVPPSRALLALGIVVAANIAFEMGMVFYNAFLPDLAPPDRLGRVSGYGWGLGYAGGLGALVVVLVTLVQPETPWFGLSTEDGENIRATNLVVAGWLALFSLPLFLWVREDKSAISRGGNSVREAYKQLGRTFSSIQKYRQIVRLLVARMLYNDGLVTIFAFGGIYAVGTFGFSFQEILVFGIVLNVTAGLGAVSLGFLDDLLGGKRTLEISILGLGVATVIAVVAPSKAWLWVAGTLIGIFSGPNQSASRSLLGRFVPPESENEFFGFFAFSGKATAFIGPLFLGIFTGVFGTQRAGIAIVVLLLFGGYLVLRGLDEEEGIRAGGRDLLAGRSDEA